MCVDNFQCLSKLFKNQLSPKDCFEIDTRDISLNSYTIVCFKTNYNLETVMSEAVVLWEIIQKRF